MAKGGVAGGGGGGGGDGVGWRGEADVLEMHSEPRSKALGKSHCFCKSLAKP